MDKVLFIYTIEYKVDLFDEAKCVDVYAYSKDLAYSFLDFHVGFVMVRKVISSRVATENDIKYGLGLGTVILKEVK